MSTGTTARADKGSGSSSKVVSGGSKKKKKRKKPSPSRTSGGSSRSTRSQRKSLAVVYDIDGPRVRLGVLWFLSALVALVVGPVAVALLYGITAVAAAGQSARCWRSRKVTPNVFGAAGFAGLIPVMAVFGPAGAGLAVLALPAGALFLSGITRRSASEALAEAGYTIQVALFPGLAAASVVLLRDLGAGAAIAVVLLVSAYECGDFLVGTGAPNSFEGPIAGIAAVMVVTFSLAALEVSPFSFGSAFAFGGLAALLSPVGQLAASAVLPRAGSRAPALRRLDSLLLTGPVWYVLIDLFLV